MMGKLEQTMYILPSIFNFSVQLTVLQELVVISIQSDAADQEREREESQKKLNEALLEKEQVSSDLNTMERSFADLFKRLEKYKDVVQGYKKVRKQTEISADLTEFWLFYCKITSVPCSSEWGDTESLRTGLSGQDQKGGAALPDP